MNINDKIYVAGHNGLVGSELVKILKEDGYKNIITFSHKDLDLTDQLQTKQFFDLYKPDYVFLAAARVGGIYYNSTYPADFTYDNLMIECNIIKSCYDYGIKKLVMLGSSCFKPGTLVLTSSGFKNIEDIKKGDEVLTHKNNFKKVYHITKKEYVGNLKRIKFFGWDDIFCTPDHEILTKNGYKRSDELNERDHILIPLNIPKDIRDEINIFDDDNNIMYNWYKDILNLSKNYLEVGFKESSDMEYNGYVYDLSVEDDFSYTANGVAVHNCIYPKFSEQPIKEEYLLSGYLEKTNEGYAIAKIAGIIMCQKFNSQYGTNFISVMPTNLYGTLKDNYDPKTSHVLPGMIRKFHDAKIKNLSEVELWGTGSPYREFLHVTDLANAVIFLMDNYNSSEIINVGSGKEITIKDLAYMIKDIVGYKGDIYFNNNYPDGTPRKFLDSTKIKKLGWEPKIDLYDGIKKTYDEIIKFDIFK